VDPSLSPSSLCALADGRIQKQPKIATLYRHCTVNSKSAALITNGICNFLIKRLAFERSFFVLEEQNTKKQSDVTH
jgi:TolB-like protein